MRGYHYLKLNNQLDLILNIRHEITNTIFRKVKNKPANKIFGVGVLKAELIVRQLMLVKIGKNTLNEALLEAIGKKGGKIKYPLPIEWIIILESYNFKISKGHCKVLWYGFLIKIIAYGTIYSFNYLIKSLLNSFFDKNLTRNHSVYFDGLSLSNLPSQEGKSYNLMSWYLEWENRKRNLRYLDHNIKRAKPIKIDGIQIRGVNSPIPLLTNFGAILKYITWIFSAVLLVVFDLFKGGWWNSIIFYEASKAYAMKLQKPENIAKHYLFHNSGSIYRPLWTYEAEEKGAEISLYFYSTNCESFKRSTGYPIQGNSWQVMNWPSYLVWDKYQADFIKRAVGDSAKIEITGNICFQSVDADLLLLPERSVGVFDVQPVRDSFYQTLAIDYEYYIPETACSFLNDIYEAIIAINGNMVLKRKRKIGNLAHSKYRIALEKLSERPNFLLVESDCAAQKVIEQCDVVLSMPFTSTAIIGRQLGKPSAYYDPHGKVEKDDRAAHGIEVLIGKVELQKWLESVLITA